MKNTRILGAIITVAFFAAGAHVFAQKMQAAWHYYNTNAVITVIGEITAIETAVRGWGAGSGTHLFIKTNKGPLTVFAGPADFLNEKISLAKGDRITVTGARTEAGSVSGIIAREIQKGTVKAVLRNNDGTPRWAGQGGMHRR